MKLQEILDQLSDGELSQLYLGEGLEGINAENISRVAKAINTGLTDLHTRFFLREERLRIRLDPERQLYPLRSQYSDNHNGPGTERFIEGSFQDNLLKVEQVLTEANVPLALNEPEKPFSVETPTLGVLKVPQEILDKRMDLPPELRTDTLTVVYRANHPTLSEDVGLDDAEDYEVELPYSHLQALLYFVASRVHNPVGMTNQFHMGNSYAQLYEMECQKLSLGDLQIERSVGNNRFRRNGWV